MKLIQDLSLIYLLRWGTGLAQRSVERMILVIAHIFLVGGNSDTPQGTFLSHSDLSADK
jgi:hypothetical protein